MTEKQSFDIFPAEYFSRSSQDVAQDLVGELLVHTPTDGVALVGRIVETEAYAQDDPACHAWGNLHPAGGAKRTDGRSAALFGKPGTAYVYLNYGMYWLLNVITEPEGIAGAVLIRAVEPVSGIQQMRQNRPRIRRDIELTNGPGKLTLAFGVGKAHHDRPLTAAPLFLARNGGSDALRVKTSARVGISKGIDLQWRYFAADNPFVSPGRPSDQVPPAQRKRRPRKA